MKKLVLLFVVTHSILVSCKKTYQCDCNVFDQNGNYISTKVYKYKEIKREDALSSCNSNSGVAGNSTVKCGMIN